MENFDRDYDWSLQGIVNGATRRSRLVIGWLFWAVIGYRGLGVDPGVMNDGKYERFLTGHAAAPCAASSRPT
jgi:hypothetical protein